MKYFYIIILLSCFGCYESTRNCKDFKTGAFRSEVVINGVTYKSKFYRARDVQVEIYDTKTDSAQLRWINDCEVIFKTINPKSMADKKDVHLKILTTTDTSYTFEYSYVGETKKQKGVAYRLE